MSKAIAINEEQLFTDFGKLSKEHKKEVVDFIAYLKVKEEIEATKEILSDKDLFRSIIRGDEDFNAGRFKKWSEIKSIKGRNQWYKVGVGFHLRSTQPTKPSGIITILFSTPAPQRPIQRQVRCDNSRTI